MSEKDEKPVDDDSAKSSQTSSASFANDTTKPIAINSSIQGRRSQNVEEQDPMRKQLAEIPISELLSTANTMSNMMMAHKIALEDNFKLEPGMDITGPLMSLSPILGASPPKSTPSSPTLHSKVKEMVHEAFWDSLTTEFETHKNDNISDKKYELSMQLLIDVKQKVIELLLPQHSKLKEDIQDKLDVKIIEQLSSVGALDLLDYSNYLLELLGKLCAPVRDELLAELKKSNDLTVRYRGIMELMELMKLDLANFTLNKFKPHIKAHSIDYERSKFNEILQQQASVGIDGLQYTKIWLTRSVERFDSQYDLKETVDQSRKRYNEPELDFNESASSQTNDDTHIFKDLIDKILNQAYCELLEWDSSKQELYPETLLFDESTFNILSEQFRNLTLVSSILISTFAFARQFNINEDNQFKVLVKSHVITLITEIYDAEDKDAAEKLKFETITARLIDDLRKDERVTNIESQKELFEKQIFDLRNPSNRIRELVRRRILEFVDTLLNMDTTYLSKGPSAKSPPPVSFPLGLSILEHEITMIMAQFVKITRYNRRVYNIHYKSIIENHIKSLIRD